jgi:IS5 family transposase
MKASASKPLPRFIETMLAQKQVTSRLHERACRNRPLSGEQKETSRQKSRIRARIKHVFDDLTYTAAAPK